MCNVFCKYVIRFETKLLVKKFNRKMKENKEQYVDQYKKAKLNKKNT